MIELIGGFIIGWMLCRYYRKKYKEASHDN